MPHSLAELSSRHLPDLSDSSFQIPLADTSDLLANDDDDFFRGADDSLSTPMPPRVIHEPLTLSQLTPKPQPQPAAKTLNPFPSLSAKAGQSTKALNVAKMASEDRSLRRAEVTSKLKVSTIPARGHSGSFENLKVEVETLVNNCTTVKPLPVKPTRPKLKPTVAAGGIPEQPKRSGLPKSESTYGITTALKEVPSSRPAVAISRGAEIDASSSSHSADPDQSYANTSVGSIAGNGVAQRLLMYGQTFMPPLDLLSSEQPSETTSRKRSSPDPRISSQADTPLTLSQVSPCKSNAAENSSPRDPHVPIATSPMRPPTKRPVSRMTASPHRSKKGKAMSVPPSVLQPSIRKNASAAVHTKDNGLRKPKAKTPRRAENVPRNGKGKERPICNSAGSSSQEAPCQQKDRDASRSAPAARGANPDTEAISEHQAASQPAMAGRITQFRTASTSTTLAPTRPTKPIGFNFQLDSRLDSRKDDPEDKKMSRKASYLALPVPDFKALHATHEAQLALRKEQIVPKYPQPIELNTESRAKEREKFDEMIRERERETERALEQRKKEKEAEEEREIREMRKKAVPKAHEVPEWYKEAPRKKEINERWEIVG